MEVEIGATTVRPVSLFYSYSHRDEKYRRTLQMHLAVLRRSGLIAEWHDREICAGSDWRGEIDRNLAEADIVLLLVSPDFLASDYCWGEEMTRHSIAMSVARLASSPSSCARAGGGTHL
jgi:hypothetical protein